MGNDINQEREDLKISWMIMATISAALLILRAIGVAIFQPEFEALIIYVPTLLIGVASIWVSRSSRSGVDAP
ncbi:MAG: hypothetical protein QW390_01190 [Candidatus Bathyarchaeia archaeon]